MVAIKSVYEILGGDFVCFFVDFEVIFVWEFG